MNGLEVRNAFHIGLELPTTKGASRSTYEVGVEIKHMYRHMRIPGRLVRWR